MWMQATLRSPSLNFASLLLPVFFLASPFLKETYTSSLTQFIYFPCKVARSQWSFLQTRDSNSATVHVEKQCAVWSAEHFPENPQLLFTLLLNFPILSGLTGEGLMSPRCATAALGNCRDKFHLFHETRRSIRCIHGRTTAREVSGRPFTAEDRVRA
jgi:hypothetical protein